MIPTIDTERLHLRGLRQDDLDDFAAMYADPEVMRYLADGRPLGRDDAWRSMATHLGHWHLRGYGQWALVDRATGVFVGRAGLWRPEGWPGLEVGWVLGRPHWGRGYATEAARAAIDYAFTEVGAGEICSLIDPANTGSIRVAERVGERFDREVEVLGRKAKLYSRRAEGACVPPVPPD